LVFSSTLAVGTVLPQAAPSHAGSLELSWNAPTTNADGGPLTDLAGYRVYYETAPVTCPGGSTFVTVASPTAAPSADTVVGYRLAGLTSGITYHVGVTAVDLDGNESACSNQASAIASGMDPPSALVVRLYESVLGRSGDVAGLAAWTDYLRANCNAGGFNTLSRGFFDSQEFRSARPLSLNGLVAVLYRTFLGRHPDPAELVGWAGVFRQARLGVALQGFIQSAEFQNLLPNRGDAAAVTMIVLRLYQEILQRDPDPAGLGGWVSYIATTGDLEGAALSFLASQEFDNRALTSRDYLTVLYRAFRDGASDPAGLDGWETMLQDTLFQVVDAGFVSSTEFQQLVPQLCG
jgi:hypothetical protein